MNSTQSNFAKVKESTFGGNSFEDREDISQSNQTNAFYQSHLRRFYANNANPSVT